MDGFFGHPHLPAENPLANVLRPLRGQMQTFDVTRDVVRLRRPRSPANRCDPCRGRIHESALQGALRKSYGLSAVTGQALEIRNTNRSNLRAAQWILRSQYGSALLDVFVTNGLVHRLFRFAQIEKKSKWSSSVEICVICG